LSSGSQHHHGEASPISTSSIRHRTTAYEHLRLKRNGDQYIHFVCRAEVNIATEKRLQFQRATVHQVMPISTPTQTHLRIRKRRSSASFVERKSTSPRRCVSNFDTDSTTHDWDREAAYGNQQCSSWLEQYLRYSSSMQYRSRYNGLCVTFGGAVDWKSRQLKPTAQSTTEYRHWPMIDASNGMCGSHFGGAQGMAWFGFCLLSSICFLSVFSLA